MPPTAEPMSMGGPETLRPASDALHRFCYAHARFASGVRRNLPDELDSA